MQNDSTNKPSGKDSSDSYKDHLYALILAGGGGTRLWPRSRNKTPKQFLPLFLENQTLTELTFLRFQKLVPIDRIFCVTVSEDYKKEILREIPEFKKENIVVEPARRETGPAHALGAYIISKLDKDAVIITEAADRLVSPVHRYLQVLTASAKIAYEKRVLVALGVPPRYPHTGLGHIKRGERLDDVGDVAFFKLEKFVEKPPLELAKEYTESKEYYWNAGEFVWRADVLLEEIANYAPEITKHLVRIGKGEKIEDVYKDMPAIAIDYAVAEKSKNFYVVHGDFNWTDIGDWKEVWENSKKDDFGNVIIDGSAKGGEIINIDTSDALVHKDGRLIAIVDVDNIIVVDTPDALLICSKSKAQNVKKVVEKLKAENRTELL
ncbi:MAG: mannose-1-phosphate guanylyltransferase [Candidatus Woesebacteria bacterium]|nr:MAG: mannose-1-phosphate guanylyltransferase [Candidatus Woesebacteria bacterium]